MTVRLKTGLLVENMRAYLEGSGYVLVTSKIEESLFDGGVGFHFTAKPRPAPKVVQ